MRLEVVNVHKNYNMRGTQVPVLKGVSINIAAGEFVALLGASGAGKSTLLHLLGGIDEPSEGEVLLDGEDLYKIEERARTSIRNKRIGFIFQFYHLMSEFTAIENVMLPALVAGNSRDKVKLRALELLEEVGLAQRSEHHPAELSGGEQQRVAIARALINEPEVLLCDEPTGNLDSQTGTNICDLLVQLNKNKKYTIVVATHSKELATIANRTIKIRDGKLE